jgi:3-dehydroquinate synthase
MTNSQVLKAEISQTPRVEFGPLEQKAYVKVFILADENTHAACAPQLLALCPYLHHSILLEVDAGEESKTIYTSMNLWEELAANGGTRNSLLINLGGGMITDLGGFVAGIYKRGIDFVNIPTSLLAQVDAAIGGKVGIDFNGLKNEIGIFKTAEITIIDPGFLSTLDKRNFISGLAEVLKYGLIYSPEIFQLLQSERYCEAECLDLLVHKCVEAKLEIVQQDPYDNGLRQILNFGHTVGHALESLFLEDEDRITLLHGEAIAAGMICEGYISHKISGLPHAALDEICTLVAGLFPKVEIEKSDFPKILKFMGADKKRESNSIRMSLITSIGQAKWGIEVREDTIAESLAFYQIQMAN